MTFGLSTGEVAVVVIVLGLVFGWSLVPRLGEAIGGLFSGGRRVEGAKGPKDER